jgi:hypothetical protein
MALERLIEGKIVSLQANSPHYLHNQTVVSLLCMLKKTKKHLSIYRLPKGLPYIDREVLHHLITLINA